VDRLQAPGVEAVDTLPALAADPDEADLTQDPQVLGDLRLRDADPLDQVRDRPLTAGEQVQDLPPAGLGHRVERVCRRRRPCHATNHIYRYGNVSTRARRSEARTNVTRYPTSVAAWSGT
jgi:hypothetical protein